LALFAKVVDAAEALAVLSLRLTVAMNTDENNSNAKITASQKRLGFLIPQPQRVNRYVN
jgi:hypothetical protein